jgi:uncharacterized membrane protein YcaP (DUF421 family)
MHPLLNTLNSDMFHMPLPIVEKILRPGHRLSLPGGLPAPLRQARTRPAQPFDLVVLLSLSNTVQNAMIGDDNSVSGGIIGAFALLAINWVLAWALFRSPKVTAQLEGSPTTLIRDGVVDEAALKSQTLTHEDLITVLNRNGFNDPAEIQHCILEPNGTFYVKGITPSSDELERRQMLTLLHDLTTEVKTLRSLLRPSA